jgi:uncharacterized protein YjbI with pentapeptide repeats
MGKISSFTATLTMTTRAGAFAARLYFSPTITAAVTSPTARPANAYVRKPVSFAEFSDAVLAATMFQGATGKNLNFKSANLNKARMGLGTSFPAANFTGSTMFQASFMDSDLSQAVFTDCLMQNAILQGCDLRGADLRHVEAKEIRLSKSDLSQARLMGANLMRGSLRMATLYDTDLRGANLFGVDFYKAKLNHDTLLDKANLTRAVFLQTFMDQPGDPDA